MASDPGFPSWQALETGAGGMGGVRLRAARLSISLATYDGGLPKRRASTVCVNPVALRSAGQYAGFKARIGKKDREAKRDARRAEKIAKRAERHLGHEKPGRADRRRRRR